MGEINRRYTSEYMMAKCAYVSIWLGEPYKCINEGSIGEGILSTLKLKFYS